MKKIITILLTICSINLFAQTAKDSLLKVMSNEVCDEFNKKDISTFKGENVEKELGMLMMPSIMNHISAIETIYGGGVDDEKAMNKLGMDLGMRLVGNCPKFMEFSVDMAQKAKDEKKRYNKTDADAVITTKKVEVEESISGIILVINPADITSINFKTTNGKVEKFYWLSSFENAEKLATNPAKYLNKKASISFIENSVYDAAKKTYKKIKVITGIEFK